MQSSVLGSYTEDRLCYLCSLLLAPNFQEHKFTFYSRKKKNHFKFIKAVDNASFSVKLKCYLTELATYNPLVFWLILLIINWCRVWWTTSGRAKHVYTTYEGFCFRNCLFENLAIIRNSKDYLTQKTGNLKY